MNENDRLVMIQSDVKEIKDRLLGVPGGDPGMIVRVDRLEQSNQKIGWLAGTAAGAAITSIVGLIFKHFHT